METLKAASVKEFQRLTACGPGSPNSVIEPDTRDPNQLDIKDLSAREIEGIVEKLGVVQQTVNNWISDSILVFAVPHVSSKHRQDVLGGFASLFYAL